MSGKTFLAIAAAAVGAFLLWRRFSGKPTDSAATAPGAAPTGATFAERLEQLLDPMLEEVYRQSPEGASGMDAASASGGGGSSTSSSPEPTFHTTGTGSRTTTPP
jgi:hypothetical protein